MKIALLTPTFSHFSGIDRVVETQAEELLGQGHDVTVYALEAAIEPQGYDVKVIGMPAGQLLQRIYRLLFFLDVQKVRKTTASLKGYDLIISHFYPMNVIAARAKKRFGIRYEAYNYGIGFEHLFTNFTERAYMKMFRRLANRSMKAADEVYSISRFLQDELERETGINSKLADKLVYRKIDRQKFHPGVNGSSVREKHGLGGEPVVLFVGRISPHKGTHLLIEAFKEVRKERAGARLIIVGKPTFDSYFESLKKMADENVTFAGFVADEELPSYYGACNVYATASRWEGFDIPVVEAQYCGKPVAAFDVCSHREVIKEGTLVEDGDPVKLAAAILKYI
ncbi:MAG: glycosyltransferase family 4 protein [Actinomycetota bacterium]